MPGTSGVLVLVESRGLVRNVLDVRCRRVVLAVQVDSTAKLSFIVQQVEESRSPRP